MTPKKALLIIVVLIIALLLVFVWAVGRQNSPAAGDNQTTGNFSSVQKNTADNQDKTEIDGILEKKSKNGELSAEDQATLDQYIETEVDKKIKKINQEASNRSYTQDEVDFILNPQKTVEENLSSGN